MATRKTKRRAPNNASPREASQPGATGTQMPQSDPMKKPFTPEVLDRTVIAVPLLDKIKKDGETKVQPIIIDLNLDYHGGREAARERAQKLVKTSSRNLGLDPKQQNVNETKSKLSHQYLLCRSRRACDSRTGAPRQSWTSQKLPAIPARRRQRTGPIPHLAGLSR